MKIISIYNNKGGVGKTTTTKRLAKYFEEIHQKSLLIDLDPQANLTSQFLNENEITLTINEVLCEDEDINKAIYKNSEYIDILPSSLNLLQANNKMLLNSITHTNRADGYLKRNLENLQKVYDYILIDCPPTMDLLPSNALAITDKVIIPVNVDNYSVDGIEMLLQKIDEIKVNCNKDLKIAGIFLNKNKAIAKVYKEFYDNFREYIPYMMESKIGEYAIINKNTFEDNEKEIKNHKVYKQYENLFKELNL